MIDSAWARTQIGPRAKLVLRDFPFYCYSRASRRVTSSNARGALVRRKNVGANMQ